MNNTKPQVTFWQIWNMCFGFLGIQFGFALQNSNVSRIFQTLGASIEELPILWVAAPLTGLLVQPIVGYYSDRTWNWLGRRRPYFLAGALLASIALICMPRSPTLWVAAGLLWVLDASINIAMEPFRAFVGDQLPERQRPSGYLMQSFFIGVGSVIASLLPWLFEKMGVSNVGTGSGAASIPDTVRFSFDIGAAVLAGAILWTVITTREYPPAELHGFADSTPPSEGVVPGGAAHAASRGALWLGVGIAGALLVWHFERRAELYILCGLFGGWGLALLLNRARSSDGMFATLMRDIDGMPGRMRQLIPVQFFSWLALFAMWLYTNAAVTQVHFHATDTVGAAYNEGANWAGVLFAAYNGFAALAAILIPVMVRRFGLAVSHCINLVLGGVGLASFLLIRDPDWLLASMVGVGFAWASIVSLPYALLAGSVPSRKMGVYMGVFNFFIVIPQLVAASVLSDVLKPLLGGQSINVLLVGGVSFAIAGVLALRVR
ncbi:MAG TPA: MFS transporter [Steroidobacteraceae bacterium]